MLKFHTWPPQPGEVELTISFMDLTDDSANAEVHYAKMGTAVGRLLHDNMPVAGPMAVEAIATAIIDQDQHANRFNGLSQTFLEGVNQVMAVASEGVGNV